MCCDLCDLYEKCQEVVSPEAICCGECAQVLACEDSAVAGQHMMDDDFDDLDDEDDDLDDDDDDLDDLYDDDLDDDLDDDDDDEEGDYESRH